MILDGGVAVCLFLSAHRAVIFAISQLSCYTGHRWRAHSAPVIFRKVEDWKQMHIEEGEKQERQGRERPTGKEMMRGKGRPVIAEIMSRP